MKCFLYRYISNWLQGCIFISPDLLRDFANLNTSTTCGVPEYIIKNHYKDKGKNAGLKIVQYSAVSKPWNVQISIHLFAPAKAVSIYPMFKFPKIWYPIHVYMLKITKDLQVVVKNISDYNSYEASNIVQSVISTNEVEVVRNDMVYLLEPAGAALRTPIPEIKSHQPLNLPYLSRIF